MGTALPMIDSYAHEVLKERKYETRVRRQQQKIDAMVSRAKTEIEKLEQKRETEKKRIRNRKIKYKTCFR